ncbi:glycosyltransferase family 2 protein [Loktanella salsilacus]|uniref:glycosyltransferase family 2 protein n=1 Tax=Loktanella salsilacus TaxID=195913 RepID=UPI0030017125
MKAATASKEGYDLSVVVPVHNAEAHLPILVKQVFELKKTGVRCQMICLDDASTDSSVAILRELAQHHDGLEIIEQTHNSGAGLARNKAWEYASGRYTIFFDADDTLHGEVIAEAIKDLDTNPDVDVAVFAYRYEREATASFTDMAFEDKRTFDLLLEGNAVTTGSMDNMARLLTFTNYPWNKILRTEHYKREGMEFGKTKVNNDILGHWHSLLLARNIMIRDAVICTHIVHPQGSNLTNSFGIDRLMMFDALKETYDFLKSKPALRRRFAHHFWALTDRLINWARPRIDPSFILQFEMCYADLLGELDLSDLARMRTKHSPTLANSIVNHLIR